MHSDELVDAILAAPEARARQGLLNAHRHQITLDIIRMLKARADWVERDDARQALAIGRVAEEVAAFLNDEARALALWAQANANNSLGNYDLAVGHYEQAASLFRAAGNALEAARTAIGQVDALMYLDRYEAAQTLAESARTQFAAHNDLRSQATIDLNLGNLSARLGHLPQALDYFERALAAYEQLGDPLYAAMARANQANVHTLLDNFVQAERLYALARPVFEANDLRTAVAMVDHDIAFLQYARGQYAEAFRTFERARAAFTALAIPQKMAYMDLNESDVCLDLNLPADVLRLAKQAEASFAGLGMGHEQAHARVNQAVALAREGQGSAALTLLSQAHAAFAGQGNDTWAAHADLQQAEVLHRLGQRAHAARLASAAAEAYRRQGLKTKLAYAHILAAQIAAAEGQHPAALEALAAAQAALDGLAAPWLSQRVEACYGRVHEGLNDPQRAAYHYGQAAEQIDRAAVSIPAEEHRTAFVADKLAPYQALAALAAPHNAGEAFAWAERAKSRALVDLLAAGVRPRWRAADAVDEARLAKLQALREELNWLYTRLTRGAAPGEAGPPAGGPELWEKIQVREREVSALWRDLQAKHAEPLSLQRVAPLTVEAVQAQLPPRTALLEYFIARDQLMAFVATRDQVKVWPELVSLDALTPLLEALAFQLAKGQYGPAYLARHRRTLLAALHDVLSRLHDALLGPLRPALAGADDIIIVPHGPLHRLPFQILFTDGQYLIEQHAISYAPSAAVLTFCWRKATARRALSGPALFMGVPDARATRMADEARSLAQLFPDAACLSGESASLEQLRRLAPGCGLLHLAAHGLFRPEAPLLSGIQLADHWLTAQDAYELELNASLVTLSACESGLGHVAGGDDLVGLVRGFLYAGAASLLVSLWIVDDESTARLMADFYQALLEGQTKTQALRRAQRRLQQEYEHPYYWAPLALVGNQQ